MLQRLTLARTAMLSVLALAFAIALRPATDNDLWWHMRTGQLMVRRHWLLGVDPLSHTSGVHRPPSDWLGQIWLYATWKVGGLTLVSIAVAVVAVAGCAFIAASTRGPGLLRAGLVALAAATSSLFWSARPQMISFLGSCIVAWVLTRARFGKPPTWWLVAVFVVWSNTHLGWFYGIALLYAALAGAALDRWLAARRHDPDADRCDPVLRRLLWVTLASSAACLVNPVGWRGPWLILTQISVATSYVEESQPPSLHDSAAWPFFLLLALTVVVLAVRWRKVHLAELAPVAMVTVVSLTATRTVSLFAAVAVPVVSWHLAALLDERRARREAAGDAPEVREGTAPAFNAVVLAVVLLVAALLGSQRISDAAVQRALHEYPVGAAAWVRGHRPPGPLFNTFDWGGWLTWHLPEYPVSIDGRAELYTDDLTVYARMNRPEVVLGVADRQRDNVAIVPTGTAFARAFAGSPDWRRAYRDDVATVFVRRVPLT